MAVAPSPISLEPGEAVAFATQGEAATGIPSEALTWSVEESGGGTVDSAGNYTAPDAEGTFHVVASSMAQTRLKASGRIDVRRRGIRVRIVPSTASLATGGSTTFVAIVRGTRGGQSTGVTWSVQEGAGGGTIDPSGNYAAPGNPGTFHVVAASVADPSKKATAAITVTASAGIAVVISPSNASTPGHGKVSFKAAVTGIGSGQSSAVTWSVKEGGSAGSVDAAGNYTAPASAGTGHVVATSVADPSKTATATVSITAAPTIAVSIAPSTESVLAGSVTSFSATVTGVSAGQSTDVTWSVQEGGSGGSVDASGRYTAPGTPGTFHVVATSVADTSKSATAAITVTAAPNITVTISPSSGSTQPGGTVNFTASVTGTSGGQSTAVSWSVQEGAAGGTVNGSGLYTAPSSAGTFHVIATSIADNEESASATVTVSSPPSGSSIIPADRVTTWNPGLNAVGGIPNRTTIYKTLSPSGGDDTAAIQSALDACPANQVVKLTAGNFQITGDGLSITRSNVVLRGSGPTQTVLTKPSGTNYPVVIIGLRWFKYTQPVALTANAAKGANTVTVASNPGYKVGELVHLNQLSDDTRSDTVPPVRKVFWGTNAPPGGPERGWFDEYNRPIGQTLEIASVNGNQLTFTTPFHIDFETALQAHIVRISNGNGLPQVDTVRYSGIEDLAVVNGEGGDGGGNIHLFATAYSWVKNVESSGSIGHSCNLDGTFRSEVRDSYFHSTPDPNPGGAGYGIGLNQYASDNLYENNVVWNFNKMTVARASGGGNVFGYNYFQDGYGSTYREIVEIGGGPNHYACSHMELFEGNEGFNFDTESYWGNSIYGTVFRNHWTGLRRSASPLDLVDAWNRRAVGVQVATWWYSFVGNVLGFQGMPLLSGTDFHGNKYNQTHFIYQSDINNLNDDSAVPMWKIGYEGTHWPDVADPLVVARTYRHGNYDYVTNSVAWDSSNSNHAIPASLYLSSKPAFFGSNPWPWVDPTAATESGRLGVLPAKVRFDAAHPSTRYATFP